jgi:hypothetical protein
VQILQQNCGYYPNPRSALVSYFECYSFFIVLANIYSDIEKENNYIAGGEQVLLLIILNHPTISSFVLNIPCD